MQAYGSLALENNSEVGEAVLGRCSISCLYTSAFKLPAKEADPQLAMGPPRKGFGDFPYLSSGGRLVDSLKEQLQKGLGWSWHTSSGFLRPTLVP